MRKTIIRLAKPLGAAIAVACLCNFQTMAGEPMIKSGEKLAFLGDSITQQGAGPQSGYVRLVMSGLEANGIKAECIPAGIGGHKSNDMLARLERDVLSKKPQFMTLSCGVNDVWHGANGVPLDKYKENIRALVEQAQAANVKVVVLTATMIGEDQTNANNQKLAPYNDFLRELAKEKGYPLADLNAQMQEAVKEAAAKLPKPSNGNYLTNDGVHMNPFGNRMMATGVLRALGLDDAQIEKAKAAWQAIPGSCEITGKARLSFEQLDKLNQIAAERKTSPFDLVNEELNKAVDTILKGK